MGLGVPAILNKNIVLHIFAKLKNPRMCYSTQQNETLKNVAKRFKAEVDNPCNFLQSELINGFAHQQTPIIIDKTPGIICTDYSWGLIPSWSKDRDIRKLTLNAKIESLEEKPSFKNCIANRCLVIATAYYEWHWNDEKGKVKQKYQINSQDQDIFAFAGLYSTWIDKKNGAGVNTYTIITTEANDVMSYVHNNKRRMPVMLKPGDEAAWLDPRNAVKDFAFPYQANLVAFALL